MTDPNGAAGSAAPPNQNDAMPAVVQRLTEDYCAAVSGLKDEVKKSHSSLNDRLSAIENRIGEMKRLEADLPREVSFTNEFDPYRLKFAKDEPDGGRAIFNEMLRSKPVGQGPMVSLVDEIQRASDQLYLVSAFLKADRERQGVEITRSDVEGLKSYQRFVRLREHLKNALDSTTSGEGSQWVPTGMSAQVMAKVALELRVASLFKTFEQPTEPYTWPFQTTLPIAQKTSQQTTYTDPYAAIADYTNEAFPSGKPTANTTFSVAKIRCLQVVSGEFIEDTIIPALPWLTEQIVYGITSGWDDACVNSDTNGTHFDTDTTGSTSVRKTIDGLRDYVFGSGGLGTAAGGVSMGGAAPTAAKLRAVRAKMGVFGTQLDRLAWLTSMIGIIHLLNLTEVLTVDKYGAGATILTGELGKFDTSPIIVSGYMRDDVNASGVNGASANNFTEIGCVHRANWMWGTRPGLGVEMERLKITDQSMALMHDRRSFKYVGAYTDPVVAFLYNITNAV